MWWLIGLGALIVLSRRRSHVVYHCCNVRQGADIREKNDRGIREYFAANARRAYITKNLPIAYDTHEWDHSSRKCRKCLRDALELMYLGCEISKKCYSIEDFNEICCSDARVVV